MDIDMKSIIALMLFFYTTSCYAECQTMEIVKASITKQMPTAKMQELGPLGTQLFLVNFNNIPPVTHHKADAILIADKPDAPRIAVVLFIAGCFVDASFPERGLFEQIMGRPL